MMFKRAATILNRLVECLFTVQFTGTKDKVFSYANSLPAQSGQTWQDAQTAAPPKRKHKPSVAKVATTETSPKQTQKVVLAVLGQGGLQRQILASQPVSQSPKRKRSVAQPTTQAQSPKQTRKPAQTTNGKDGLQQATPASKTRQPAKQAPKPKQARAKSTTQADSQARGKAPAQTRTVIQSGGRGKQVAVAPKTRQRAK